MEDDNPVSDDEIEGVISHGRQPLVRNHLNVENACKSNVRNHGDDSIMGLKVVVRILCRCVIMLAVIVFFK